MQKPKSTYRNTNKRVTKRTTKRVAQKVKGGAGGFGWGQSTREYSLGSEYDEPSGTTVPTRGSSNLGSIDAWIGLVAVILGIVVLAKSR
jgi:hypothetical protein